MASASFLVTTLAGLRALQSTSLEIPFLGPPFPVLFFPGLYWSLGMQAADLAVSQQQIEVCTAGFWCLMLLLGVKVVHCVGFKSGLLKLALVRAPCRVTARLARV